MRTAIALLLTILSGGLIEYTNAAGAAADRWVGAPVVAQSQVLTGAMINETIRSMEEALSRRDAAGLVSHMSPDARIRGTVTTSSSSGSQTQTVDLNRDQYLAALNQHFAMARDYTHDVEITGMNIRPDGKSATVSTTTTQTITTARGEKIVSTSAGTSTVSLRQGRPLVTDLQYSATVTVY